jgi:rare lipoprotein A
MRSFIFITCLILLVSFSSGCSALKLVAKGTAGTVAVSLKVLTFPLTPSKRANGIYVGYASWYGDYFHGRRTANGEIYNQFRYTAAHRSLPFNTLVEVTNLKTRRNVIVRINDRGPFIRGRIIDLSFAAAKKIGMVEDGVQKVRLKILR